MFQHMTGFEVEFQWIATTASLLKKMVCDTSCDLRVLIM